MSTHDRGFTLVETLVVVVVMAVIATVLTAVVSVILRNDGPVSLRVDDARALHGVNTWLAQDAASTAADDFVIPGAWGDCAGPAPAGSPIVTMSWIEDTGSAITYVAHYHYVPDGSTYQIVRYTCSGPGSAPFPSTQSIRLTSGLSSTPPNVVPVLDGAEVIGVELELFTVEGESVFVDGDSRNPAATLPSTTTTTTLAPPTTTTTTTTTTTVPSGPCGLVSINSSANPIANQGNGIRRLSADVTITVQLSGICGSPTLRYDRGDGAGVQTEGPAGGAYPTYTFVLERDAAQPWSEAVHPLTVFDGATALSPAFDLEVT